jgi:hypothetical protein
MLIAIHHPVPLSPVQVSWKSGTINVEVFWCSAAQNSTVATNGKVTTELNVDCGCIENSADAALLAGHSYRLEFG